MRRNAFTLVELLVVIAIIGMLVALLLPAIQSAREAGRRNTCANQFKQLGLACANHLDQQGFFPTGGWGWNFSGDPNRGFGVAQPGGWAFNILPYLEYNDLYNMGKGTGQGSATSKTGITQMNQTVVPIYTCPSRRAAALYPLTGAAAVNSNLAQGNLVAKSDYAISCGTGIAANPGDDEVFQAPVGSYSAGQGYAWPDYSNPRDTASFQNGVSYVRSQVTAANVVRGLSHIIVLGEKALDAGNYTSGSDAGDNEELFVGQDNDLYRTTYYPPQQDVANVTNEVDDFGSAHPGGINFSAGDGSVHFVSYDIGNSPASIAVYQSFGTCRAETQDTIWDK
jgi:prepilin-type N-terminal cleavage/methylation domain-containing protein